MFIKADYHRSQLTDRLGIRHIEHNCIEFIQPLCTGGNVLVGSNIYPMRYGAIIIIDCEQPHCTAPANPESYIRNIVTVDKPSLYAFLEASGAKSLLGDLFSHGSFYAILNSDGIDAAQRIFKKLSELCLKNSTDTDIFFSIFELVLTLRDSSVTSDNRSGNIGIAERAIEYLSQNFMHSINTEKVAEKLNLNKYYLCHVFKKSTGITISEYILEKRLSAANKLLSDKSLSINDIAVQTGFSSESYFISKYKQKYGISPGKRRNGKTV